MALVALILPVCFDGSNLRLLPVCVNFASVAYSHLRNHPVRNRRNSDSPPHPHTPVQRTLQTRRRSLAVLPYKPKIRRKVYTSESVTDAGGQNGGFLWVAYGVGSKIIRFVGGRRHKILGLVVLLGCGEGKAYTFWGFGGRLVLQQHPFFEKSLEGGDAWTLK